MLGNKINNVKGEGAQITIDYIAGMSIFLLAVAFVFQFMYGLFAPFQSGSDEVTLAADRASTILVERLLVSDNIRAANVIDEKKLDNFFTELKNDEADALNDTGLSTTKTVAFDLNVSVVNLTSNRLIMQEGRSLPENTDVGQTRRAVLIVNSTNGSQSYAILSVRVW